MWCLYSSENQFLAFSSRLNLIHLLPHFSSFNFIVFSRLAMNNHHFAWWNISRFWYNQCFDLQKLLTKKNEFYYRMFTYCWCPHQSTHISFYKHVSHNSTMCKNFFLCLLICWMFVRSVSYWWSSSTMSR